MIEIVTKKRNTMLIRVSSIIAIVTNRNIILVREVGSIEVTSESMEKVLSYLTDDSLN